MPETSVPLQQNSSANEKTIPIPDIVSERQGGPTGAPSPETDTTDDHNGHTKISSWDELIESVGQPSLEISSLPSTMDEVNRRAVDFSQALRQEIAEIEKQRLFWTKSEKRLEELKTELAMLKQHLLSQELAEVKARAKVLKQERLARKARESQINQENLTEDLLRQVGKRLLDRGLSQDFVKDIAANLKSWVERTKINLTHQTDLKKLKKGLVLEMKKMIKVQPLAHLNNEGQNVLALIGPAGGGKSESALKMAMNYQLAFRKKVALIIAADGPATEFQQTALLASVAKLSFSIATDPADLKDTISRMEDKEVIVVDFALNNVGNKKRLEEYIQAGSPGETHLVIPANTDLSDMMLAIQNFKQFNFNNLIFTKTDQMKKIGYVIETNYRVGKQISYISNGSTIPDDFEAANALKLAHMILKGA